MYPNIQSVLKNQLSSLEKQLEDACKQLNVTRASSKPCYVERKVTSIKLNPEVIGKLKGLIMSGRSESVSDVIEQALNNYFDLMKEKEGNWESVNHKKRLPAGKKRLFMGIDANSTAYKVLKGYDTQIKNLQALINAYEEK